MTTQDDRALIFTMVLLLIIAGHAIATNRSHHAGGNRAEITAPVASSTIQTN